MRRRDNGCSTISNADGFPELQLALTHLADASGGACYDCFDHFVECLGLFGDGSGEAGIDRSCRDVIEQESGEVKEGERTERSREDFVCARDTRQLCTKEAASGQWRQERGSRAVGPYFSSSGGVQGVGGVEDSLGFGTVALKLKAMTEAVGDQLS